VRCTHAADLWAIAAQTQAERAVLIVPAAVVAAHPGAPEGYRIARQFVDTSAQSPLPLPLAVYELEKLPRGAP